MRDYESWAVIRPRRGREKVYVIIKMSWNFLDISLKVLVHVDFSRELKIFVRMCNTSLQKKRARSGEANIPGHVRGRRGEMPAENKIQSEKGQAGRGKGENIRVCRFGTNAREKQRPAAPTQIFTQYICPE